MKTMCEFFEVNEWYVINPDFGNYFDWFHNNFKDNGFNTCPPPRFIKLSLKEVSK